MIFTTHPCCFHRMALGSISRYWRSHPMVSDPGAWPVWPGPSARAAATDSDISDSLLMA